VQIFPAIPRSNKLTKIGSSQLKKNTFDLYLVALFSSPVLLDVFYYFFPDGFSEIDRITVPVSGTYLLALSYTATGPGGGGAGIVLCRKKDRLFVGGRSDIVELTEDEVLQVWMDEGTRVKDVNLMGVMLRPRLFIIPGTTMQ
jgi:hypothetical protein